MVAESWGVSPLQAARELDDDPEQLALVCIPLLRYAEAKRALDGAKTEDDAALKAWKGSPLMEAVKQNTVGLHKERKRRAAAERAEAQRKGKER